MDIKPYRLLTALGSQILNEDPEIMQPCPLHPGTTPSLLVSRNPDTNRIRFNCRDTKCCFDGDAVTLAATVLKELPSVTVRRFQDGGSLVETLNEPVSDEEADAYVEDRDSRVRVESYITRCRHNLRENPSLCGLRAGLSHGSLQLVPPQLGLLCRTEVPSSLREFARPRYLTGRHLVFPYTYKGTITHLRTQPSDSILQPLHTVSFNQPNPGVFMEENLVPVNCDLFITMNPRAAALIYGEFAAETGNPPPVVSIIDLPLPPSASGIETINLVDTEDVQLSLVDALRLFKSEYQVEGSDRQVPIYVCRTGQPIINLSTEQLVRYLSVRTTRMVLPWWIVAEMGQLVAAGRQDEVHRAIGEVDGLPDTKRAILSAAATGNSTRISCPDQVVEILKARYIRNSSFHKLANGRLFKVGHDSIKAIMPDNSEETLANFSLQMNSKIITQSGKIIYNCNVTPEDHGVPTLNIKVPETAFRTSASIQAAVAQAFSARHETPYLSAYGLPGYRWPDLAARLVSGCPSYNEITCLGATDVGEVHFPQITLRIPDRSVVPQERIFTIPDSVLALYANISMPRPAHSFRDVFTELFIEAQTNLNRAGLVLALMHIMECVLAAYKTVQYKVPAMPQHLLFVESEKGTWRYVFKNLTFILGDMDAVPVALSKSSILGHGRNEYAALGHLPWYGEIPAAYARNLEDQLISSPASIIGCVGSSSILHINNDRVTFVNPPDTGMGDWHFPPTLLDILAGTFPLMLMEVISGAGNNRYVSEDLPCLGMYRRVCGILGLKPSRTVESLAGMYYDGTDAVGVDALFGVMHRLYIGQYESDNFRLEYNLPGDQDRGMIHVLDDAVLVRRSVLALAGRYIHGGLFREGHIENELKRRRFLTTISDEYDKKQFWCVSRGVWDQHIVRVPLTLNTVTASEPVKLSRVS